MSSGVDLTTVPWPSLVVRGDGTVLASKAAVELLGFVPGNVRDLEERIEVLTPEGEAIIAGAQPWRRACQGERFQEDEQWRDRATASQLALRVRGRELDGAALLDLDRRGQGEHWVNQQLAALNEAILSRASASEPVSLRDVLLRLVMLACEMTGARYGALGVLDRERRKLKDFIYSGVSEETADPHAEPFGNPAAQRMLGRITRADDPGRTYELKYADGRPVPADALPVVRALRDGAVINLEVVIERREGATFHGQISAAPVHSPGGVKLGVVVVYQDISARKELERFPEDFAAIVAHDLRTPLQSVLMQIDVLLSQASGDASTVPVATLQMMKRSGHRLERITRDLLDASRIDAHRVVLDRRDVDLPELVSALVNQLQGALGTHRVSVEIAGEPPPISGDPVRLEQIVTNLLENSSKYSADGTPIRIVIGAERKGAVVTIEDRGPGVPPEEIPHLFDRYFQTCRARAGKRGLELGLYITSGLVEAHGGRITVESTPGIGSVFRIWFPAVQS